MSKKETLKQHRQFRNQLIILSVIMISIGIYISYTTLIVFGSVIGLLGLLNAYTYNVNKKIFDNRKS